MANSKHARVRADTTLRQMPNVGPAFARDLALLDIARPADLVGLDAFELTRRLEQLTGARQDPCVIDTFMALIDFAEGAPARPWFSYTARRKSILAGRTQSSR